MTSRHHQPVDYMARMMMTTNNGQGFDDKAVMAGQIATTTIDGQGFDDKGEMAVK